ncbi:MAG: HAMP domain-containing histidine kinase [Bdellovibrionales bacterium]|nr:HAMP domain-containing histidine kinase [Bdellovibrionales bacterium]
MMTMLICNLLITASLFFLLKIELAKRDKDIAIIRSNEVADLLELHGPEFFRSGKASNRLLNYNRLLIVIVDSNGISLFEKFPGDLKNFDKFNTEKTIQESLSKLGSYTVRPKNPIEETIEIYSQRLEPYRLAVGFDTDSSEDFANLYFISSLVLVTLTASGSAIYAYFFAIRKLKPINQLIDTVKSIRMGNLFTIPPAADSKYELNELTRLFNDMILHIQKLITSLQSSIDAIAHDLRTPITHFSLKLESLINNDQQISKETVGELLEEIHGISNLVNTLLEITEADSKSLNLKKDVCQLRPIIQECIDIYEYILEDRISHIELVCHDTITIWADRNRLKRVFANLIDNAIKFSDNHLSIRILCSETNQQIIITVEDKGVGISNEDISKIWQRLYRADPSRTSGGMGLGLSFVKSIIDAHGWSIEVESRLRHGSKFRIIVPIEPNQV